MIRVEEVIFDADFCVEFVIVRKIKGEWVNGRQSEGTKKINVYGIVNSTSSKDMEMLPEGDRIHGLKTFYTNQELYLTSNQTTADICEYQGKKYRLLQGFDYGNNGYYKAIGTLVGGV